jgi:ArsR family transcriptional regulator
VRHGFIDRMQADAASDRLRTLAHPARLMILACLTGGEQSVGDLERLLDLKQPGLSQQLAELRQAGWVATRRQSKSVFYRLAEPRVGLLLTILDDLLSDRPAAADRLLAALQDRADAGPAAESRPTQAAVFAVTGTQANS